MISAVTGIKISGVIGMGTASMMTVAQVSPEHLSSVSQWPMTTVMSGVVLACVYLMYRLSLDTHKELRLISAEQSAALSKLGDRIDQQTNAAVLLAEKLENSPCLVFQGLTDRRSEYGHRTRPEAAAVIREMVKKIETEHGESAGPG